MPDFTRAEIEEVVKPSRQFESANLAGIDLSGANLSTSNLRWAYLEGAKYDQYTKFPEEFDPEEHWMTLRE